MNLHRPSYNGNPTFPNQPHGQPNAFNPQALYNNGIDQRLPNYNPLQNASLQQRLNDGSQRSQSPSLHNPAYNVNPVIPAKRPRGPEDDNAQFYSPRSQTPSHPGYQSSTAGLPNAPGPNPYQHLQHATPNGATPSPRQHQQSFSQPGRPPTSGPPNQAAINPSSRMSTNPGVRGQTQQQMPYAGNAGNMQQPPTSQPASGDTLRQTYEKQAQQLNAARPNVQNRMNVGGMSAMSDTNINSATPNNPNRAMMQPQNQSPAFQQQQNQPQSGEDAFMNSILGFTGRAGRALEPDPKVYDRPISYYQLFTLAQGFRVMFAGPNQWSPVAVKLGFTGQQIAPAAVALYELFNRNLGDFSKQWFATMQKRQQALRNNTMASSMNEMGSSSSPAGGAQPFHAPQQPRSSSPQALQHQMQSQGQQRQSQPLMNGQPPPNMPQGSPLLQDASVPVLEQQVSRNDFSPERPSSAKAPFGAVDDIQQMTPRPSPRDKAQQKQSIATPSDRTDLDRRRMTGTASPRASQLEVSPGDVGSAKRPSSDGRDTQRADSELYHGGLPIDKVAAAADALIRERPCIPRLDEMGTIDIEALSLSIQSGIHSEMRYALDHLVAISHDSKLGVDLIHCDGLLDALYDCAEDQLDVLSEASTKVLDHIVYPNFEQLSREATRESKELHDEHVFASQDYELDRAADRLIAVTTILRNFSIPDSKNNHDELTKEESSTFFAGMVRRIGTHPRILRTSRNLMDFMKDIITVLSNVSHRLSILTKDDASALLHLLLAFGPESSPSLNDECQLTFASYDPKRHQYLPSAVDSLAKLLAQYDPNRPLFKAVFSEDRATTPDTELLSRAFALAVAPIPDRQSSSIYPDRAVLVKLTQERNPFFSQAMLLGDILSTMIQGADEKLARTWLGSGDGWAPSLLNLLVMLGFEREPPGSRTHMGRMIDFDIAGCGVIAHRGLSMLKTLGEKANKLEGEDASLTVRPDRKMVLNAALTSHFDPGSLRLLLGFGSPDG